MEPRRWKTWRAPYAFSRDTVSIDGMLLGEHLTTRGAYESGAASPDGRHLPRFYRRQPSAPTEAIGAEPAVTRHAGAGSILRGRPVDFDTISRSGKQTLPRWLYTRISKSFRRKGRGFGGGRCDVIASTWRDGHWKSAVAATGACWRVCSTAESAIKHRGYGYRASPGPAACSQSLQCVGHLSGFI